MACAGTFIDREKTLIKGVLAGLSRVVAALGASLLDRFEAKARLREVARLSGMSDAELAVHGLARDDIVGHIFRDKFCY